MTVTEDSNAKLFKAAQVSIGMFGILSEVTLRVRSKFNLKEIRTSQTLTYCLNNLDTLVQGDHKYVKMWVEFYNDFCVLYQTGETNDDIKPLPWWLGYLTVSHDLYKLVHSVGKLNRYSVFSNYKLIDFPIDIMCGRFCHFG